MLHNIYILYFALHCKQKKKEKEKEKKESARELH